ncbi:hypothetical protein NDU88_004473 [Pleurodeles waltl]|uniref:Uncharacterized protein n=1 Tax=Pleurodeles waltl TaxID=8319 RepID=A0AAV7PD34_PLEWA|nr:hypothetical protein NDU88_004473 [Pleurodeles waltl]
MAPRLLAVSMRLQFIQLKYFCRVYYSLLRLIRRKAEAGIEESEQGNVQHLVSAPVRNKKRPELRYAALNSAVLIVFIACLKTKAIKKRPELSYAALNSAVLDVISLASGLRDHEAHKTPPKKHLLIGESDLAGRPTFIDVPWN